MMNSTSTFAHEGNVPENQDVNMLDQSATNVTVYRYINTNHVKHNTI